MLHREFSHVAPVLLPGPWAAAFVDTTDIWTKPPSARIATTWAGPYSGAILAGLGAVIVQAAPGSWVSPILHRLSFLWLETLLVNVIPFLVSEVDLVSRYLYILTS